LEDAKEEEAARKRQELAQNLLGGGSKSALGIEGFQQRD